MTLSLDSRIQKLPGVGDVLARKFRSLGVETCRDLLWHIPARYDDFRTITKVADLVPDTKVTVRVRVDMIQNKRSPRKRMIITQGLFSDDSDSIKAVWFRQPFITKNLQSGDEVYLSGNVVSDTFGLQFQNPTYERASDNPAHTARLVPVYPTTSKLSQKHIRMALRHVLPLAQSIAEPLPPDVLGPHNVMPMGEALYAIHEPQSSKQAERARERLALDELLIIQLANARLRNDLEQHKAGKIPFAKDIVQHFVQHLPFQLTDAQRKCTWQILQDLENDRPMNRLLEGDVGSGKTVVAAVATANAADAKRQTAYMAPTEILANQQYDALCSLLPNKNIAILTSARAELNGAKLSRPELKRRIAGNDADVVVGTHALLQEDVRFLDLGLAIIDEQHRFGVKQRKMLRRVSGTPETLPHLLSMTATPIPRTLALTVFGDLDLSILDELPQNRKPTITQRASLQALDPVFQRLHKELSVGRQAFVVCPLIAESDLLQHSSAEKVFEEWARGPLSGHTVALLHGKLKTAEKEEIMTKFQAGEINVLISTAVVEVGVDIPNATVMIIRGAERFGLAQLHQFRGRVGRAEHQSYCYVIPDEDNAGAERLDAFVQSNDGFELAEFDLKTRGPGDVYGTRQSGLPDLKVANLTDVALIERAQQIAETLLETDPELSQHKDFQTRVTRFLNDLHLE